MTLENKIRDLLARLSTLSDAPASNLDPKTSHGSSDGKVPSGINEKSRIRATNPNRPPPKERSLFDWYAWQFARAGDDYDRLLSLYLLGEREYMERSFADANRISLRKGELTENDVQDGGAAERESAVRIVEWYEGLSAQEVAINERQSEAWVRKARLAHGRNPETGRKLADFKGWNEERRHAEVALLSNRMGQKATADRLGVAKSTVQRYWPREEAVAA